MMVLGAKGHAKDLLMVLKEQFAPHELVFYDDISTDLPDLLYSAYSIIKTKEEARVYLKSAPEFCLGIGNPLYRRLLYEAFSEIGIPISIICQTALVGKHDVILGKGINIMPHVFISNSVHIGEGSLVNTAASIHHDVFIDEFCEIMPGSRILGGAILGKDCRVGAGAQVLPGIKIGSSTIVGAGAVVTRDLPEGVVAIGIPASIARTL
jgi:sugar O-acyltransferase (sialic acid O-acetyltransferase NeuD family)